jgi:DHA1 family bicyclomycin/chloramphenicol resistance-like MFS transporter
LSIAPFKKHAGSAAALMGATQMGIGALASVGVSVFDSHTALPMAMIMAGTAMMSVLLLAVGRRQIKHPIVMHDGDDAIVIH